MTAPSSFGKVVDDPVMNGHSHHRYSDQGQNIGSVDVTANSDSYLEASQEKLVSTYTSLIQQYLAVMCVENATFLAERFVASCKTGDSLYLLALCHYRSGCPQRAICVLEDCSDPTPNAQYLLAVCCYDLEQYGRAEEALLQSCRAQYRHAVKTGSLEISSLGSNYFSSMEEWVLAISPCPIPNGAAGLYLLGNICRRSNRNGRAITYYRMSLQLDPLLWTSFQALCEMGVKDIDPTSIFGVRPASFETDVFHMHSRPLQEQTILTPTVSDVLGTMRAYTTGASTSVTGMGMGMSMNTGSYGTARQQPVALGTPGSSTANSASKTFQFYPSSTAANRFGLISNTNKTSSRFNSPDLTPIPVNASNAHETPQPEQQAHTSIDLPSSNYHIIRRAKHVAARMYYQPSPETPHTADIRTSLQYLRGLGRSTRDNETPLRRGGQNNTLTSSSLARNPRALFLSSENKTNNTEPEDVVDHDEEGDKKSELEKLEEMKSSYGSEGVQQILELLAVLGSAWIKLCQYRCREALQIFQLLPHAQQNTGWVLHQEGRAYFEMNDFQNAERCLELMQSVEPHRMKGLDLLSTVFWQLKKEVEIAHLAQRVVDFDRMCPEAWCVVGNCFSLQKEHETALVFFKRSLQLDPCFTYTHTLSGYEYMANEDFDKAVGCFRNAIRADERHYNAWYGLGAIYHRQEKFDLAEYHFERAVAINPQSSVLRCNLGIAQYSNGKAFQALDTLSEAFRLDPHNPQARFQRATIYAAMNRPSEALAELERVRDDAPREATVHFAMGRMLKRLGRPEQAMKCFLTAMDLDPKDNQLIKSAMDKLDEPDVDEEVAAF